MSRTASHKTRLLLTAGAALLLAAACSQAPEVRAPAGVSAHAGPEFAQLHFRQPAADLQLEVQYRELTAAGTAAKWQTPADVQFPPEGGVALVPYPDADQLELRIAVVEDGMWHWSDTSQAISRPDGLTLQVGTLNRGYQPESAGTVFLVILDLPDQVQAPLDLFLTGPDGWAADAPADGFAISVDQQDLDAGYKLQYFYGLDVVPGTYRALARDYSGAEWEHRSGFTDQSFRLPPASALTAVADGPGGVLTSWQPPVSGAHTNVSLHDAAGPLLGYPHTSAASWSFSGTELPPGPLRLEVTATNWLPGAEPRLLPVPFGASNSSLEFSLPH